MGNLLLIGKNALITRILDQIGRNDEIWILHTKKTTDWWKDVIFKLVAMPIALLMQLKMCLEILWTQQHYRQLMIASGQGLVRLKFLFIIQQNQIIFCLSHRIQLISTSG